jgi:hypothetical protein
LPGNRSKGIWRYYPNINSLWLFGGYGSASWAEITFPEVDYRDQWYFNLSQCPHNCNKRGKCHLGFCYCDKGFWGVDCAQKECPNSVCWYDLPSQVQMCKHCLGRGQCNAGVCTCMDNYEGEDCSRQLCPNNCWGQGNCLIDESTLTTYCDCFPPFGGIDCKLPQCKNDCTSYAYVLICWSGHSFFFFFFFFLLLFINIYFCSVIFSFCHRFCLCCCFRSWNLSKEWQMQVQ